ncbi:hypothetical protein KIW84_013109 [Lathyrus oleraceus]|uniref:DUF7745 domain-containing protein n=1 Tax=Pisum sativum TaxID=3888 RepID=A0A9D5GXK1_PEA|nr:hypothetical protein KIW84_013109 [Pisum sativum]
MRYLEGVAQRMAGTERWASYIDDVALIMFGIVIFPNVRDSMDNVAISIFWAVKNIEIDLVPALLADIYYTMSICHSREKGSLRDCIRLLYQWFSSNLYRDIHLIETNGNHAWAQKLASLNEGSILGQLGHPMWEMPKEDEIEEFILYGGETSYIELLGKVTRAWEKVHVKDNKPKRKDTSSEESYTPWIKKMVSLVKLRFIVNPTYVPNMPNPITVSTEEVDRLKAIIARLEQDKESLEHSIYGAAYEKNQINYDLE